MSGRIVYFFSTFPVLSETFLQREVRGLLKIGEPLELVSLWKGDSSFEGTPVKRFSLWRLGELSWKLPWLLIRRPRLMMRILRKAFFSRYRYAENWHENLLGFGTAICMESDYRGEPVSEFHAVWGSLPATTAWVLGELLNVRFSMAAHAYDIFDRGGDRWLKEKLQAAAWVQTSTSYAKQHLLLAGADAENTFLIRRSLEPFPAFQKRTCLQVPLKILSVGRLVEKKGYFEQLKIYQAMKQAGIEFVATIAGGGPLEQELRNEIRRLELEPQVKLRGGIPFVEVVHCYHNADLLFFTGKVAADGDRDGLPNVIPEAMAHGLVVLTTDVSGTTEAVEEGVSGRVLPLEEPAQWVAAVRELRDNPAFVERFSQAGRNWVEREFDPVRNAEKLASLFNKDHS